MTEAVFIPSRLQKLSSNFLGYFLAEDIMEKHRNDFYALDIFEPEKLVTRCRILAAVSIAAILAAAFFIYPDRSTLPYPFGIALQILLAITTVLLYPYVLRFYLDVILAVKKSEKNSKINANFYAALCMLSGFAKGGILLSEAIKSLSTSKLDGIREEFAKINTNIFIHGLDLRTAILKVALVTKNEKLSYFLRGLANYIEERKDYNAFIENFLQMDNINRKIELTAYSDKMKNMASVFLAMLTACMTVAILAVTSMENELRDFAIYAVYFGIPMSTFMTLVMIYVGNPIKEKKREKGKEAFYLSMGCMALGSTAAILSFLELESYRIHFLIAATMLAVGSYIYTFDAKRKEAKITGELDSFLMKLRAAAELRSNIFDAIDRNTAIGKDVAPLISASRVLPAEDVLMNASEKTSHPFLSIVFYVLSMTIHKTRKISDIILILIYEFQRYAELMKVRKAVFSLTMTFSAISILLIAVSMGIMKYQFIPMVSKFAGYISYDVQLARNIAENSMVLIASSVPLTMGAVSGDFRKCFSMYIVFFIIAAAFLIF
ncbi:MAG: hypothetical protein QW532_00190 [Archaeoglobaceae archaeon]